ncbi:MAG: signal peptide peptidase SppA [Pseudomonadales bacterium]|nr:signal peptide peptidase SppA [Pseudomonadales bacterium]
MITRFFRAIWNFITAAKQTTGNLIFIAIVAFILVSIFAVDTPTIPTSAALIISPTGNIVEQKQFVDPVAKLITGNEGDDTETRLRDILNAITEATHDKRIKIIVLQLDRLNGASFSRLEEIGNALDNFKAAGKSVYAYGKSYSQTQYYLASHADEVFLERDANQMFGGVFLPGLGVYPTYFKAALDKLDITYNVYKAGRYKGAVEPYLRDDMSPDAKLDNQVWLDALWDKYTRTVVTHRDISAETFKQYTHQYETILSEVNNDAVKAAINYNLVDGTLSNKEWNTLLTDIVGSQANGKGKTFQQINFKNYLSIVRPPMPAMSTADSKVAVITASGAIYDGTRPAGDIGSDSTVKLIRQARLDESVKAVVLRVDSPGGSATAADQIRKELARTQAAGKPVVVSMGSYAASAGYFIAAEADKIYAAETTITGSIGVFATIPSFEKVADKFGVSSDGVGTTPLSGSINVLQGIDPIYDKLIQNSITSTYQRFISLVSTGRNISLEQADTLAQGRVWVATDALQHGLIDAIGDLNDAIESAAILAEISQYDILDIQQSLSPQELLMQEILNNTTSLAETMGLSSSAYFSLPGIGSMSKLQTDIKQLLEMSETPGIYLRCLECQL